jgi:hypothetical protein
MNLCVITATRGTSAHLDATAASVRALGAGGRHVLVCPGGEHARLAGRFPGLEILIERESGLYAALNTGLARVRNDEAFTWVNDDDVLCPAGISVALARLKAEPATGVVYGRVGLMNDGAERLGELPVAHQPSDLLALLASGIMPLAQPGTIMRGELAGKLGGFDPSYRLAGDLDYFVRALQAGANFAFVNVELAQFRLRAGQLSKDEPAVAAEFARAVAKLPRGADSGARWRFRWANRGVYLERIRRHGFVRMPTLYRHG